MPDATNDSWNSPSNVQPLGCGTNLEDRIMSRRFDQLYGERKLSEGYPDVVGMSFAKYKEQHQVNASQAASMERLLTYLRRLVDLSRMTNVVVVGCGTDPQTVRILLDKGFNAVGIEPVESHVQSARAYLNRDDLVLQGKAESMPLPDSSQHMVICESVMEHVDSPSRSLAEMHRVLAPGGIAYICTTNRYRFRFFGDNGEFTTPYYNWFPKLIKECYVFHQLHYTPWRAGWTTRPAVHWYSYADLCQLGRDAGFAQFYAVLDLLQKDDPMVRRSPLRRLLLHLVQYHPWVRAMALTQLGDTIVMLKRPTSA
jgi:ubiquinone/menaquinone biosynthesis C-methylase UbiE